MKNLLFALPLIVMLCSCNRPRVISVDKFCGITAITKINENGDTIVESSFMDAGGKLHNINHKYVNGVLVKY